MTLTNIASCPATHPVENRLGYPGWRVAVACHIGVLTGFATVFIYSFSFMMKPLQHAFGWNREQISLAFSLAAVSVAICSPFMGKLFDRFEPRKLIAGCMAAFGLGVGSLAYLTPHLGQFCELDLIPYMLRRYFRLRAFATLYGLIYSIFAFAGAAAPLLLGHIYDATGSYIGILSIFSGVTVVAAFGMLALPAYRGASFDLAEQSATAPALHSLINTEKGALFENH